MSFTSVYRLCIRIFRERSPSTSKRPPNSIDLSMEIFLIFYCICARVGWKVRRLTKKKLCYSNETWHALNSIFPDTNYIISRPLISRDISKLPGKLTKGVVFHQDCGFELVDHTLYSPHLAQSDYFSVPQHEQNNNNQPTKQTNKHLAGKQYGPIMRSLCSSWLFWGSGYITRESKR